MEFYDLNATEKLKAAGEAGLITAAITEGLMFAFWAATSTEINTEFSIGLGVGSFAGNSLIEYLRLSRRG